MKRSLLYPLAVTFAFGLWKVTAIGLEPAPAEVPSNDTTLVATGVDSNAPPARVIEPPRIALPAPLAEVVRLAESGVSDEVVLAYIQRSPSLQPLTADQILYLRDLGISAQILTALIEYHPAAPAPSEAVPAPTVPQYPPTMVPETVDNPEPPPGPAAVEQNYFYSSLAPYGSWLDLPGYGWCWRPTAAVTCSTWRPYCDSGYWAWSDCGWYWNSYYSWGWAPFHYGRWCEYPRYGWVWCPDRVWSPAWVCWRQSGSHCGWAPLPPGARFSASGWTFRGATVGANFGFGLPASSFTFVGLDHFTDRHAGNHRVHGREADAVFRQTQVNNDFVAGPNHRIVNRGVDPTRVQAASRQPIRQVAVADLEKNRRSLAAPTFGQRNTGPAATFASRAPASRTSAASAVSPWSSTRSSGYGTSTGPARSEPHIAIPRQSQSLPGDISRGVPSAAVPRPSPALSPQPRPFSSPRSAPAFSVPQAHSAVVPQRSIASPPQQPAPASSPGRSGVESMGTQRR